MDRRLVRVELFILLLLATSLACGIIASPAVSTPTGEAIAALPSATTIEMESGEELPRWRLYERALADILLGPVGRIVPDLSQDHGLCEWEIWGQERLDVYVWAECQISDLSIGTATSAPAIIRLAEDGSITEVIMPDEGWGNIRDLFPADVLQRIFDNDFDAVSAMGHITLRHADPTIPPQIVLDGIVLP